jgi:hypothetical protein
MNRSLVRSLTFLLLMFASVPLQASLIGITSWYEVEIWKFPDPVQDPSNLPSDPADIPYNQRVEADHTSLSFDRTFQGEAPRSAAGLTSEYSVRVAANSDFKNLRAAYETTLTNFLASNWRPGFYDDGSGSQMDGNWGSSGIMATVIDDVVTLVGPGSGTYDLTYVLWLSGSNISSLDTDFDVGLTPTTVGVVSAYGSNLYGPYFELPQDQVVGQFVSLTVQANMGSPTPTRLAMSFQTYVIPPGLYFPDDQAASILYNGSILWDYESTATIRKLIVDLPSGADPTQYSLLFGSGTNHDVEFRVNNHPVPEPSSIAVFGGLALLGFWRSRGSAKSGGRRS